MGLVAALAMLATSIAGASSDDANVNFGSLYYEGQILRTVVPPAAMPHQGMESLYAIMGGVDDQLAVVATAPGDRDYRGGKWAFHSVTWNVSPYLLTSEADVHAAGTAGDVTITRVPENDFKCPVQPN
jgi:hypothetical protein